MPTTKFTAQNLDPNATTANEWKDWNAALYNTDGVTELGGYVRLARYCQIGKKVSGYIAADNIGNPAGSLIMFSLPVAPKTNATYPQATGGGLVNHFYSSANHFQTGSCHIPPTYTKIGVYDASASTWNTGGGHMIYVNFTYEAA